MIISLYGLRISKSTRIKNTTGSVMLCNVNKNMD
jgi:hypothetical protein